MYLRPIPSFFLSLALTALIMGVAVSPASSAPPGQGAVFSTPALQSAGSTGAPVQWSGVFWEVHGDSKLSDEELFFLQAGRHYYRLRISGAPQVRSGALVSVRGTLSGNTIETSPGNINKDAPAPAVAAIGTKTVLVINVVWPGATLTATGAQEQNFMFGTDSRTVASYYKEVSYGQLTWAGSVTPRYTITDPGQCSLNGLANQAEDAATAGGYTPSSYDALMINAPNLYCGSAGYGQIGGKRTWVEDGLWNLDDGYARLVPTHEIGHSLGLYHSHGLECDSVTVTSSCLDNASAHNEEYGNAWDVMGNNWPGDARDSVTWFSAKQEMILGWLGGSRVNTVTASGTYSLVPLETSGTTSPQVLVLNTPIHTYYVEYRQPIGQDAFMSAFPAAIHSVQISARTAFGNDTGPFALDFTPGSDVSCAYCDWYDAPLTVGRSFTDPENTFTITPTSENGTSASINVTFNTVTSYPLSVTKSGAGTGTVASSPAGINCGSTCTANFASASSVALTATPASGSTFAGWSGACSGTGSCTVAMSAAQSVSATFDATSTGTRYEETAGTFNNWIPSSDADGTYRTSKVAGSIAKFSFSGTGITWLTRKGPAQGKATVVIDGVNKGTFDLYGASAQSYSVPFTGLAAATHTITVKVLRAKNSSATDTNVAVDGFTVGAATTQENATKVRYDTWRGATASAASGGSYRSSAKTASSFRLTFTGIGIDWLTTTGPGWGQAEVYIDGIDKGIVDLYAASSGYQTVKSYAGLTAGSHTITVEVLGTKNPSATSTKVSVDGFVVH